MSIARYRSARGFTFIEATRAVVAWLWVGALATASGVAAPMPEQAPILPAPSPLVEEGELARLPALYLVIDPQAGRLEVRARGIILDSAPLKGAEARIYRTLRRGAEVTERPAVWRVAPQAPAEFRRFIVPRQLKPYTGEEEKEATPASVPESVVVTPPEEPSPEPPVSYRIPLEGGWELTLGPTLPSSGANHRLGSLFAGGWKALVGDPQPHPPRLALALAPEDAQRFHHLFQPGLAILLAAPAAPP